MQPSHCHWTGAGTWGPPSKQQLKGVGGRARMAPGLKPTLGPEATRFLSLNIAASTSLQGATGVHEEIPFLPNTDGLFLELLYVSWVLKDA